MDAISQIYLLLLMIFYFPELSTKNQLESAAALLKRFYQAPLFWKFYEASLKRRRIARAVGRSENPGVPVLFGGHNLPPLVEIG